MGHKNSSSTLRKKIIAKLSHNLGISSDKATGKHFYHALILVLNDIMAEKRAKFCELSKNQGSKQIYYLCMEFLIGKSLKNSLFNLNLHHDIEAALLNLGVNLETLYEYESDAGLGNGGLGRLAACFLDSLATLKYPAIGYCLRYEYGIFSQKLIDGWQTESPDFWLPGGRAWIISHPEKTLSVMFDGKIEESWNGTHHQINHVNATKILAVPCDIMVAGKNGKGISKLRIWKSKSSDFDMNLFNSGDYVRAMEQNAMAEVLTKILYPEDNHPEGKSLRLSQQYFLVSATIQDITRKHLQNYPTLDNLPDVAAIHLNDTHPVLAIPELMRLMLDICGYTWDDAWDIVTRTFAY